MTASRLSNFLATWAAVLTAVATAYAFIHTYRESNAKVADDRHKQTFDMYRVYTSKDFMPIREKALEVLRDAEKCRDTGAALKKMSDMERFTFIEFFDLVQACVDARLCDEGLVSQFFAPYANGHWLAFKDYVTAVRSGERVEDFLKNARPFGYGLEKLGRHMTAFSGCPPKPTR